MQITLIDQEVQANPVLKALISKLSRITFTEEQWTVIRKVTDIKVVNYLELPNHDLTIFDIHIEGITFRELLELKYLLEWGTDLKVTHEEKIIDLNIFGLLQIELLLKEKELDLPVKIQVIRSTNADDKLCAFDMEYKDNDRSDFDNYCVKLITK